MGHTYCLTALGNCTVYAVLDGLQVPLATSAGGQVCFVAPGSKVQTDAPALLTRCFKGAPTTAQGGGASSPAGYVLHPLSGEQVNAAVQHNCCLLLPVELRQLSLAPASSANVQDMLLLLTPGGDMPYGWLSTPAGVRLFWLYGEPHLSVGYTYEILITQRSAAELTACVTAVIPAV